MTGNVHAWKDDSGTWHASVPVGPDQEERAWQVIAAALIASSNDDAPHYVGEFMRVVLVPSLSSAARAVYRESWPSEYEKEEFPGD